MATLTTKTSTKALAAYALEQFGLDLSGAERAEVIAALADNGVLLSGGDAAPAKVETPAQGAELAADETAEQETEASTELSLGDVARMLHAQRKVKIKIASTETDKDDVTVSPNGYTYLIKRDAVVEVPEAVKTALDCATTFKYTMNKDGRTLDGPFEVLAYPYTFLGYVE